MPKGKKDSSAGTERPHRQGVVYLVGAGPGGTGLITRRGHDLLCRADVIVYDYLVDPGLLGSVKKGARTVCCADLGKGHAGTDPAAQGRINRFIVRQAKNGRMVVRLKNGDPVIFGRLSEEVAPLIKAGIPWEVVPGVTSASSAAVAAGLSLTERGISSSVVFVTGREASKDAQSIDWQAVSRCGTVVLYMAVERIREIASRLMLYRRPETPVAVVSRAGHKDERVLHATLGSVAGVVRRSRIRPPAVFIISDNHSSRSVAAPARKVLVTGTSPDPWKGLSAELVHVPMIDIQPLKSYQRIDRLIRVLDQFDWILFTSRYGVKYFFERLARLRRDTRDLKGIRVAAVGEATARALKHFGVEADLVAREETAGGLVRDLRRVDMNGCRVLVPCSTLSTDALADELSKSDADVTTVPVYRNVMPRGLPRLALADLSAIAFSSPSGVRNFVKRYGRPPSGMTIRCMGPVTMAEARKVLGRAYRYRLKDR